MGRFIVRRLLTAIPLLLGISLVLFTLIHLAPGGPSDIYADNPTVRAEDLAQMEENLGLNDPLPVQFMRWFGAAVRGDFGRSLLTNVPVRDEILDRFPATVQLAVAGLIVAVAIGVPLGLLAAISRRRWLDSALMVVALGGLSMPSFWLGLLLLLLFGVQLGWFPVLGGSGPRALILPAFTLGFAVVGLAAAAFVLGADGLGYVDEGRRFVAGHFAIWGRGALGGTERGWRADLLELTGGSPGALAMAVALAVSARFVAVRELGTAAALSMALGYAIWILAAQNPDSARHLVPLVFFSLAAAMTATRMVAATVYGFTVANDLAREVGVVRAVSTQVGYLTGSLAGGVAYAVGGFAGLGVVFGGLFVAATLPYVSVCAARRLVVASEGACP